ncbi:MAG: TonB-dependent receptor [Melioribacteraceae bacterium]|nr:TonB-dependent receptor [Melioribacteraceae bacterium]
MKIYSLILISVILASALYAQDGNKIHVIDSVVVIAEKDQPIPQVSSIATKFFIPLQNIPLSVGVVNNSLINNQNNLVLGDALKNISGINTQTGNGVHDYFIIRGMNSLENSLILTDGTLEPEVTYYNLYNVDRVELLKGPGSFLYGSNPLSGTVNLVRKQPQFGIFVNLQSSFGQYNSFRNSVDAGYGDQESGLAARINLLWENANNFRDDKKNKIMAINPSVTLFANSDLIFKLNFEFIKSEYKPDSGLPLMYDPFQQKLITIADVERKTSYQTPFDFSDQKIMRIKLYADYNISENTSFNSKLYFSQLDWQSQGTLVNGAYPNMTGSMDVYRSMSKLDDLRNLFGMQNELNLRFKTGSVKHNLITGLEWNQLNEEYEYDVAAFLPNIDLFNPVETAVEDQLLMFPYLRGDVTNKVIATYLIDQITLSEKMQLIVGLRYDIIKFENSANNYLADRDYKNLSPMIGVNYSIVKNITLYANSGRAYAPPSSQVIGDQNAERSQQFEFGIKQSYLNGRINVDLSYYHLTKDNISIPSTDGITKQLGDQISQGFETEIRVEPMRGWFAFISYAYSDVELTKFYESVPVGQDDYGMPIYMVFDRTGNNPAFTPEHILNIWTTKGYENRLGIGGGLRYLSEQFINVDNDFNLDEALIFDAIVYYKWNQFKFSVNVKNLTDEKYEMRGFGGTSVIPAAPRSVYGKINFNL